MPGTDLKKTKCLAVRNFYRISTTSHHKARFISNLTSNKNDVFNECYRYSEKGNPSFSYEESNLPLSYRRLVGFKAIKLGS